MRVDSGGKVIRFESARQPRRRALVSLVVPIFNEQDSIDIFLERVEAALSALRDGLEFEIVFVNDGSTDATERRIAAAAATREGIVLVNLSRNFGKEAALTAGLAHAAGDAVIPMDVDLQDPPEVIPEMIARWQEGARVVNASRASRDEDGWLKRMSAAAFYRVFNVLADQPIPTGVGDFRLMDREVVDAIHRLGERSRFNKALFSWVGFETAEIRYARPSRAAGSSSWNYWKLWKLALDGIFSSSTAPLRLWTYVGLAMAAASLIYAAVIFLRTLFFGIDVPGYASTAVMILTFGGMNLFALGIIGEYVGRIYTEVRQRPLYIVRSRLSSSEPEA